MRRSLHTRRAALALIALMMAAASPIILPSSREYAPSAEVVMMDARVAADAESAAVVPSGGFTGAATQGDNDLTQTAAMLLVGTLLIGIGSAVRRVV